MVNDLHGAREASLIMLREEYFSIQADFKNATFSFYQYDCSMAIYAENLFFHTGSFR